MALDTAADSDRGSQITVRYGDLDVGSPAGAAILYRRIHSAAGQVCSRLDHGDLASKKNVTACADKAIADAVTQVNQPELFVVYNANHSTPLPASLVSQRLR
jgi:UrcA family protein